MDTGQDVDRLAGFSRGQAGADNIAIQQAGLLDPGQVLLGSLLQSAGTAGLMSGAGTAAKAKTGEALFGGVNNSAINTTGSSNFARAFA